MKDCFLTKNRNKAKTSALITLLNTVLEALVSATRQNGKKGNLFVQEEIKLSLFARETTVDIENAKGQQKYKNKLLQLISDFVKVSGYKSESESCSVVFNSL